MTTVKTRHNQVPAELLQNLQLVHSCERMGKLQQALDHCQKLLLKFPNNGLLFHYLGVLQLRLNQPIVAMDYLKRAIKANPNQAASYHFLGVTHCHLNELDAGILAYKKAIKLEPRLNEVYFNYAIALVQKNEFKLAEKNFKKAIDLNFATPDVFYNLGYLLQQREAFEDSIVYYEKALQLNPNYIACLANLSEVYLKQLKFEQAAKHLATLIKLRPEPHYLLKQAVVLQQIDRHELAVQYLKEIKQPTEEVYALLGASYAALNMFEAALDTYETASKLYPNNLYIITNIIHTKLKTCNWENFHELRTKLFESLQSDEYLFKYSEYYIFGFSLAQEAQFARKLGCYYQDKVTQVLKDSTFAKKPMNQKLKIGYVSANVKNHPNAYTIKSLFPNHDLNHFDITLYSTGKVDDSDIAKNLMAAAPRFVDLQGQDALSAAQTIYQDDIDILVDFTAYHNQFSSLIFALNPAKVQIGFMGTCDTRGADYIDYAFNDKTALSLDETQYFFEKIIFMPHSFYICSDDYLPQETTKLALELPEDKFIFTCFNHTLKYEPVSFAAWMKILQAVPNSILVLWVREPLAKNNLLAAAKQYNLADRLLFTTSLPREQHLGRLKHFDLFLDTFYCSAQSTAVDALSVGLPLITLYGHNGAARGASSIVKAIGMPELVTYSIEQYIEKAIYYATNQEALQALKQKLISNKQTEPLFNSALFVTHLEQAYLAVRENYQQGRKDHIFVNP